MSNWPNSMSWLQLTGMGVGIPIHLKCLGSIGMGFEFF